MSEITIIGIILIVGLFVTALLYVLFIRDNNLANAYDEKAEPVLYAKTGEIVTCLGGHEICELAKDIFVADPLQSSQFTNWRNQEPAEPNSPIMPCKTCGEPYIKSAAPYGGTWLHINGEWLTTHSD